MKLRNTKILIAGLISLSAILFGNVKAGDIPLDLKSESSGLKVIKSYKGKPDDKGILKIYELQLPEYSNALYYRGKWWPYGGNQVTGIGVTDVTNPELCKEGGMFLLLKLKDGKYLAVLPLSGDNAYSYFSPQEDRLLMKLATLGTAAVDGDLPVVCWAKSDSPYEAISKVWMQACEAPQIKGNMKPRDQKTYPEVFKYLGWCSWEGYRRSITSDSLVKELKGLNTSPVPVRYFLVDNGHFNTSTLKPDENRFPNGYKPLTDLRSEDGIKWVGMWHALLGVKNGLKPGSPPEIKDVMMEGNNKRSVAKPDAKSMETFMRYMLSDSKRDDIDFVKVDFCGPLLTYYAGTDSEKVTATLPETAKDAVPNPSASAALYSRIFQKVVAEDFNGLINCNWQTPQFIFNSGENNVGRCSGDYRLGDLERAKSHLFYSYNTIPWIGQTYWGDHDMFHSSDKFAGRMMAISKAMSGGPIYLSDKHEELVPENIMPLCYEDGLLIRPLAPAAPLEGDLFINPEDKALYRAMAPLANKSVAFVLYNLHGDTKKDLVELSSSITPEDYCSASAMIQPYSGDWKLPEEGLLVYDYTTNSAEKMGKEYKVTLKGFGDRLLQVSPIKNGWSVIGRIDKYLSAPTVEIVSCDKTQLKIKLHESGPFAIWLEKGTPKAHGITFNDMGNGVFVSNLKVKAEALEVSITK